MCKGLVLIGRSTGSRCSRRSLSAGAGNEEPIRGAPTHKWFKRRLIRQRKESCCTTTYAGMSLVNVCAAAPTVECPNSPPRLPTNFFCYSFFLHYTFDASLEFSAKRRFVTECFQSAFNPRGMRRSSCSRDKTSKKGSIRLTDRITLLTT